MFAQTDRNHYCSHFHHNHQSSHECVIVTYQSENSRVTYQIMAPPILLTDEPSIIVILT